MSGDNSFSVNWVVVAKHRPQFEAVAEHLGLSAKVIGYSGDEIMGTMDKITVPDDCLGISVEGTDKQKYQAELERLLADASQEGKIPEGVVLPGESASKEGK